MKTEYAPLPYYSLDYLVLTGSDDHTDHVAACAHRRDSDRKATAAFIVRACNSHFELLAALEETLKDLSAVSRWDQSSACASKARAAILKAKG